MTFSREDLIKSYQDGVFAGHKISDGASAARAVEAYDNGHRDGYRAGKKDAALPVISAYLVGGPRSGDIRATSHDEIVIPFMSPTVLTYSEACDSYGVAYRTGTYRRSHQLYGADFGPRAFTYVWQGYSR